ncbi:MAG: tetratricopeptide repeat protein [Methanobacterium sp.]|nr:tetratricopeptide repeat protein [Methanobacterium sp.]
MTAELARLCGYMPLALRASAGFLRRGKRKGEAIRAYVTDMRTNLQSRVVLQYSLFDLKNEELSAIKALTVVGTDFDRPAACAVGACSERILDALVEFYLLEVLPGSDRLAWLDPVRAVVAEGTDEELLQAARRRFVAHYTDVAIQASRPYQEGVGDFEGSRRRIDAEMLHLKTAIQWLHKYGDWPMECRLALADIAPQLLKGRLDWGEFENCYRDALDAAQSTDSDAGQAAATFALGYVAYYKCDNDRARDHYEAALKIWRDTGNRSGEANALSGLGEIARMQDDYPTARKHYEAALKIWRVLGHKDWVSWLEWRVRTLK